MDRLDSSGFHMPDTWQDRPNVIARPPWIVAAFLVAGLALDRTGSAPDIYEPVRFLGGGGMAMAAGALMTAAMRTLRAAGTPVETWQPTARIVTAGPYARTRNPVYVALLAGFAAIGVLANAPAVVALTPLLFAVLHVGVVKREEHYLECKFGDAYLDYRQAVPRWL